MLDTNNVDNDEVTLERTDLNITVPSFVIDRGFDH